MSAKLYFAPGACSFVPHAMLEASGAPFELLIVKLHKGEHKTAEFLAINPQGQVPVLIDGDLVLCQLIAIVCHLDDKFPEQGFLPREPAARAKALELLAWMNNTVHPTFTHVFMPQRFTDDPEAQQALRPFNLLQYRNQLAELDAMAARAAPFLLGENFSPLDAYALTLTRWAGTAKIDPTTFPNLWSLVHRVAAHSPATRALASERIQLDTYQPD
jgi:glutathione S-transferase